MNERLPRPSNQLAEALRRTVHEVLADLRAAFFAGLPNDDYIYARVKERLSRRARNAFPQHVVVAIAKEQWQRSEQRRAQVAAERNIDISNPPRKRQVVLADPPAFPTFLVRSERECQHIASVERYDTEVQRWLKARAEIARDFEFALRHLGRHPAMSRRWSRAEKMYWERWIRG